MCGIVGVISNDNKGHLDRKKFFEQALYADVLRGQDSTGVFSVSKTGEVNICKRAMPAYEFLDLKSYDSVASKFWDSPFIVGHNRKATHGTISQRNAHPFCVDNIVLVHNGGISNHRSLPGGNDFTVDSEAICHSIATIGAKETVERLRGAFVLVWYDTTTGKLYMCRNDARPLAYAYTEDGHATLFASEGHMLMWLAYRNNIPVKNISVLPQGFIYEIDKKDIFNPVKTKFAEYTPVFTGGYHGVYRPGYQHENDDYYARGSKNKGTEQKPTGNVIALPATTDTRTRSQREIRKRIRKHGTKQGDILEFESMEWTPYMNNQELGVMTGCIGDGKLLVEVKTYAVKKEDFIADAPYYGTICGIQYEQDKDITYDTLIVTDVKCGIPAKESTSIRAIVQQAINAANSADSMQGELVQGPNGTIITQDKFRELTSDGCAYCQGNINIKFHTNVKFLDQATGGGVVCHECADNLRDAALH